MSSKTPIRAVFNDSNVATGLAEYQSGEFIPLSHGGIGAALSIGSAGQVLKVNSGASALEFGSVEAIVNIDGATNLESATLAAGDKILLSDGGSEGRVLLSQLDTLFSGTSKTLTNKTISGSSNTLSNIGNSSLSNSAVTVGSTSISLGASSTTLAGMTAVSYASSNGTLPLTMASVEKRAGVKNETSSFVLPLGATINMDGTALYEAVAVLFIAQHTLAEPLSLGLQITVALTALLVSIGAAGIPHAGLVMMVIVLQAVGLPLEMQGLILAVDRVLDMFRTSVNVWSDSCGCAVIDRFSDGNTGTSAT